MPWPVAIDGPAAPATANIDAAGVGPAHAGRRRFRASARIRLRRALTLAAAAGWVVMVRPAPRRPHSERGPATDIGNACRRRGRRRSAERRRRPGLGRAAPTAGSPGAHAPAALAGGTRKSATCTTAATPPTFRPTTRRASATRWPISTATALRRVASSLRRGGAVTRAWSTGARRLRWRARRPTPQRPTARRGRAGRPVGAADDHRTPEQLRQEVLERMRALRAFRIVDALKLDEATSAGCSRSCRATTSASCRSRPSATRSCASCARTRTRHVRTTRA